MLQRKTTSSLALALSVLASVTSLGCSHGVTPGLLTRSNASRPAAASIETHPQTPDDAGAIDSISLLGPEPRGLLMHGRPSQLGAAPKPAMLSMPSPNKGTRPAGMAIDTLIMHHTSSAASAQRIGSFFSQPAAKVSSHYVVGQDGTIVQCVDDQSTAWHAGVSAFLGRSNVNGFSIGIEMCNVGDGVDPYTDAQYKALGGLVAYILTTHHIKWDHVTGHKDIALPKGRKDDPSVNFDYSRMKQAVLAVDPQAGK
jgi:N-acetyl-anhydromuramyl-L-alanine amidase AmpD